MPLTQFGEEFVHGAGATGLDAGVPTSDACNGFQVILLLPFKLGGEGVVEGGGGVLTAALGVLFQLSLAFRFEGDRVHSLALAHCISQLLGLCISALFRKGEPGT